MEVSFEGKRILVTGAGQGIGKDLVLHLSKCKATIIALSRTQANLDDLKKQDAKIETLCVDLQDWKATRSAVQSILPIDCLVNNAGVALLKPILDATEQDFDVTFNVNVKAILNVSQVIANDLIKNKKPGSIVNVSSQASHCALKDHAVYCSSKGALDMLTKCMALEFGPHNIRVNTVNPTVVMTEMGKLGWSDPNKSRSMIDKIPLKRFAEIQEVISAVVFLLSDFSSMTTGSGILVDGGFVAT